MWSPDDLLTIAARTLQYEERRLREEQAVHGIDRYTEVELHGILADGFRRDGLGAFRECLYPCASTPLLRRSDRQRCDVVLTSSPGRPVSDPTEAQRAAAAARDTLFAHEAPPCDGARCRPEEAFWLEVKLVGQHTFSRGVPVPNVTYSSELTRGLRADLDKLSTDPMIRAAAAMLVLFSVDDRTAQHDIDVLRDRSHARAGPARPFLRAGFSIADRIGNRRCTVVVVPVR